MDPGYGKGDVLVVKEGLSYDNMILQEPYDNIEQRILNDLIGEPYRATNLVKCYGKATAKVIESCKPNLENEIQIGFRNIVCLGILATRHVVEIISGDSIKSTVGIGDIVGQKFGNVIPFYSLHWYSNQSKQTQEELKTLLRKQLDE